MIFPVGRLPHGPRNLITDVPGVRVGHCTIDEGECHTGVTMVQKMEGVQTKKETFAVCTSVHVCPMSEDEILVYIATGDPMDKAGAYGIQGIFARHVEKIDGDYYNVVGLPVSAVYQKLKSWGLTG